MGQRGEGWVVLQVVIFIAIALATLLGTVELPLWLRAGGAGLVLLGGILGTLGVLSLGPSLSPFPKPRSGGQLVTDGVYGLVRHPIYAGLIIASFGWTMLWQSWPGMLLAGVLLAFFDLKSRQEERWLREKYPEYAEYQRRVRKLIPWVY